MQNSSAHNLELGINYPNLPCGPLGYETKLTRFPCLHKVMSGSLGEREKLWSCFELDLPQTYRNRKCSKRLFYKRI